MAVAAQMPARVRGLALVDEGLDVEHPPGRDRRVAAPRGDPVQPGVREADQVPERNPGVGVRAAIGGHPAAQRREHQRQSHRTHRGQAQGHEADRTVRRQRGRQGEHPDPDDRAQHQRGRLRQPEGASWLCGVVGGVPVGVGLLGRAEAHVLGHRDSVPPRGWAARLVVSHQGVGGPGGVGPRPAWTVPGCTVAALWPTGQRNPPCNRYTSLRCRGACAAPYPDCAATRMLVAHHACPRPAGRLRDDAKEVPNVD
ncbi:MAG: hypothetical protein H6R40_1516 [Gemmatimonadetes bacterium]|nr:hypothetical protein [Gemmatimonadota bacterium]